MTTKQQWNGEGLPPVGTVCECLSYDEPVQVRIIGHHPDRPERSLWYQALITNGLPDGRDSDSGSADCFRPLPRLIRATAELPDGRTVEVEWPEPVREEPKNGERYWTERSSQPFIWVGDEFDRRKLRQGRVFRTREAALQHDRAMIKLNGGEVE